MGRGLSSQQRDILKVLERFPRGPRQDGLFDKELARPGDILDALGVERTPVRYASVSRALKRLSRRGLINMYDTEEWLPGKSYLYALPQCE